MVAVLSKIVGDTLLPGREGVVMDAATPFDERFELGAVCRGLGV